MGGNPENLLDLKYVNRDGDSMRGPLLLNGEAQVHAEATSKSYVDRLVTNLTGLALLRDGSLPMLGPLVLPGAPANPNEAANMNYVDILRAYVIAQDNLRLVLAGGTMTGDIVLQGAPTLPLHPATMGYVDAADALLLPLAGGILTGPLVLAADPLVALGAATRQYVDAVPPGQPIYDAIVDAAGGAGSDYTDIVTACATEAVRASIYVISGTYNETANIVMKDGQQLIGENKDDTIIDFGDANRKLTTAGGGANRRVANLTIQGSRADYTVQLTGTTERVENCNIIGTVNANSGVQISGLYGIVKDCYITGFTKAAAVYGIEFAANYCTAYGNTIATCRRGILTAAYTLVIGNQLTGITNAQIYAAGSHVTITGNTLYGNIEIRIMGPQVDISGNVIRGPINWGSDHDFITITGNHLVACLINCNQTNSHSITIAGNTFDVSGGIEFQGYSSVVNGNVFTGSAHLQWNAMSKWNVASGNNFMASTEPNLTRITDLGLRGNQAYGNQGVPLTSEKKFQDMKNTSGGALVDGDVVVFKTGVANGNEFTTTVNQGDDAVLGVVNEAVGNNAEGCIQTLGKVVTLKVNGVINIGIGDLLGTFTAAGISQQAQAGDMAFAYALDAYAGADSLGVIDALLITPRKG